MSEQFPQPKARELTKAEHDDLIDQAFQCERRIKATMAALHADAWALAEQLYEFHELHGWTLLGYETLEEFLAQPDVGMSRSGFFRAVQTWRDLVVVKKVSAPRLRELEPSKVQEVRRAIMSGTVKPEKALDDAKALGFRDLRQLYRGLNPAPKLAAEEEPIRSPCPHCAGRGWIEPNISTEITSSEPVIEYGVKQCESGEAA